MDFFFCFKAKFFERAALDMSSNFLIKQTTVLFADNLCAVSQSEARTSITEIDNIIGQAFEMTSV